jgi:glycosyltransferase involved in cell wall biosynthesis
MVSHAARGLGIPRLCHHRFYYDRLAIDWFNKYGAEHHLFVSQALMSDLCARSERLRSSNRGIVHDGLELPPDPTDEDRRASRRQLGLPPGALIVTFAGRLHPDKGVADLLRAWSKLQPVWESRAELLVVGDDLVGRGAYRRQMQELAADLRCVARFVGFQDNVAPWWLASDLAVVPSRVEPLGGVILEAMAHARPVVASAVGGIPELVVPGQTGLLVSPASPDQLASALDRCLADESLRRRMGQAGRQRCADRFSLRASTANVLREYHRVLTSRPR